MAKTLQIVAAIVAKDEMVTRASVRLAGVVNEGKVVSDVRIVDSTLPYEVKILSGLAELVSQMTDAGINGAVFIASSVMPRYLQARKLIDRHNAVDIMTTAWMKKNQHLDAYRDTFKALLASLRTAKNKGVLVIVRDIADLHRVKLDGAVGLNGLRLDIRSGINEEYGVRVIGSTRFAGSVVVRETADGVYGDIVEDSLFGKASSFVRYGDLAVRTAISLLPQVKVNPVTIASEKF